MRTRRLFSQRGIALVAVLSAIAVIAVVTTEFTYNTGIDLAAAANARDEMRAHFLARSGMNLSRLVVKVQKDVFDRYRKYLGDVQLADYLPLMIGAFGGGKEEVAALGALLGADPGATPDGAEAPAIKGLGLSEGEFDLQVTTDDGKINVNCAAGSGNTVKQLELMLTSMVLSNAYDKLFEERDGDGQFTDRATFVKAIMDYVDKDTAAYGANGQPEDYGYQSLPQAYRARDNYLDSVDELQLVRGMDDKRWALFGAAFTVYGGCKVNVGAVNDANVIMSLIVGAAKDPEDPVLRDNLKLFALAAAVAQARTYGVMFEDLNAFAEFVKDPQGALLGDLTQQPQQAQNPAMAGLPPIQGVELDAQKLGNLARAGGRRTYRVVASAKIGKVEKTITAIWDTETQNQNMRDPKQNKGSWVYWREE
jgi:general secretion pathway protein K